MCVWWQVGRIGIFWALHWQETESILQPTTCIPWQLSPRLILLRQTGTILFRYISWKNRKNNKTIVVNQYWNKLEKIYIPIYEYIQYSNMFEYSAATYSYIKYIIYIWELDQFAIDVQRRQNVLANSSWIHVYFRICMAQYWIIWFGEALARRA